MSRLSFRCLGTAFAFSAGLALAPPIVHAQTYSINDVSVTEGQTASFTITRAGTSNQLNRQTTVQVSTQNGTAVAPGDYTARTNVTVTFPRGSTSQPFTVATINDTTPESTETFNVLLSNPSRGSIADGTGVGTILDNDRPTLSIANVSQNEGNSGTSTMTFTATLSAAAPTGGVTFNFATSSTGGTATAGTSCAAGVDYVTTSGSRTIAAGSTTATIPVTLCGDTVVEPNETFTVNITGITNATNTTASATGTILNDDAAPLPTLSINDVTVTEGAVANFTVSLSAASTQTVTVVASTANGSAVAPGDYTARSNVTLSFPAGTTTLTFAVTTIDDTAVEGTETFNVNLSSPTNATIADAQGVGTILDNDQPSLSINDVTVTEGQTATFTVSLSPASTQTVTVNYATANGTAGLADYTATSGTLTFPAGTTSRTISVATINDTAVEQTETFFVNLSGATNATIADAQGQGSILDNDAAQPNASINSTSQSSVGRVSNVVPQQNQVGNATYSVLAINDLGMHCGDLDTRIASILPPFQVLLSQVIQKGADPILNPAGVSVFYSAAANGNDPILGAAASVQTAGLMADGSSYKTNFWDFPVPGSAYDPFYPGGLGITPLPTGAFPVTADKGLPVPNVENLYIGPDGIVDRPGVSTDGFLSAVQHAMPGISNPFAANIPQLVEEKYGNKPFFVNFPFGYVAANVNWFEGAGIPFAAFDDFGRENAYPVVRVQARNAAGTNLSTVDTVLPISGEASCVNCHADPADVQNSRTTLPTTTLRNAGLPVAISLDDPNRNMPIRVSQEYAADINVLRLHDLKHGARYVSTACDGVPAGENCLTTAADPCTIGGTGGNNGTASCLTNKALVQGKPVVCQVCHYTPALDLAHVGPMAGPPGSTANGRNQMAHQSNSRVMHNHHGSLANLFPAIPAPTQDASGAITNQATRLAALEESCYQCHPGTNTKCLRGAMFNGGMLCSDCHGSMLQVGNDFSRNVSPSNAGAFQLAKDFYTNPATPRTPWANEPGCGSCHTGDAVSNLAGTTGTIVNTRDSNNRLDGLRLRQAFLTGDAKATPIVPTNKRFAEPAVPASFNGFTNPGAGNPQLYRVSTGHSGVMCEGCHGATHAEWPNANPNANDNLTANQLQGHTGVISDCDTCHTSTNPGNNLNGPHGLHPIDFQSTPWSSSSNHRTLGANYTANCQACHGGTSRDNSCGTPLSRAFNNRSLSGRAVAKGQPVGCTVCHNSTFWNNTCATR